MESHAIVEIEEGALNLVVGCRRGNTVTVERSIRLPLPEMTRSALEATLRGIGAEMLMGAAGVHVVIGERRVHHHGNTVPRLSAKDAMAFVVREVIRQSGISSREDILLDARLVRRLPGGRLQLAAAAISRGIWQPIADAFEAQQIRVLSLCTMESCLAMTAEVSGSEPSALVECNGTRARFVLCIDGIPVQVRRFLISGGAEGNEMALATQLAMELPRTLDWLREAGHPLPTRIVLGSRVGVAEESLTMLGGDGQEVVRARLPVEVAAGQSMPDIGVASLLQRIARGGAIPSLLDEPRLALPVGAGFAAAALFVGGITMCAAASAVVDGREWLRGEQLAEELAAQTSSLESRFAQFDAEGAAVDDSGDAAEDPRLAAALGMRRPISRLLAEVSGCVEDALRIEELRFASRGTVTVAGFASGSTRRETLAALAKFEQRLEALPFVVATGRDEIREAAGGFRFRIQLAWRNS